MLVTLLMACGGSTAQPSSAPQPQSCPAATASEPPPRDLNIGNTADVVRAATAPLDGTLWIHPAQYCGGAMVNPNAPPPPQPPPAANQTLTVVAGERYHAGTPAATLTTGADGTFKADLPAGRYCIVLGGARGPRPCTIDAYYEWTACNAIVDVPLKDAIHVHHMMSCGFPADMRSPPP